MRILLALKQRNYLTTFAGVVDELLRRGHAIESWKPKRADAWAPLASTAPRIRARVLARMEELGLELTSAERGRLKSIAELMEDVGATQAWIVRTADGTDPGTDDRQFPLGDHELGRVDAVRWKALERKGVVTRPRVPASRVLADAVEATYGARPS